MNEEVKKILRELLNDCQRGLTTFSRERLDNDARQICSIVRQEMVEEIRQFIEDYHILIPRKFDLKYNTHSHPNSNLLRVFDEWQELKRKWKK